jgi:hypothetical protein
MPADLVSILEAGYEKQRGRKSNEAANPATVVSRAVGYHAHDCHQPADIISEGILWAVVPYTNPELTRHALRHAAACSDLNVQVSLVDVQVVPFPCPLDRPPINQEHSYRRLQTLFRESGVRGRAAVLYTRDWMEGFCEALEPKSLVILAANKHWWPTREKKLARVLLKAGHQVMFLPVR